MPFRRKYDWLSGVELSSQAVIYLASSAKSIAAYMAINKAQSLVRKTGDLSIPMSIRNAPTKLMKERIWSRL